MTQTEEVQFKLDGLILLTEGIGRAKADGKPILNALVIVSYGDETGAYRMRAFNDGRFMETAHFSQRFGAGYAIASRSRTQSQVAARSAIAPRASELFFTAETQNGKVKGMANAGIKEFKGVAYLPTPRPPNKKSCPLEASSNVCTEERQPCRHFTRKNDDMVAAAVPLLPRIQ